MDTQPASSVEIFDFYEFSDAVTSMTELLDQEAELLAQMKIKEVGSMQAKKLELADRIAAQQKVLQADPYTCKRLSNQQIDQLRQFATAFENSMRSYELELRKTSSVNQILVKMIVDSVREQVRSQTTYGNFQMADARAQNEYMPAIKFNEKI